MQEKNIHNVGEKSSGARFMCRVKFGGASVKVGGSLEEVMAVIRVVLQVKQNTQLKECA